MLARLFQSIEHVSSGFKPLWRAYHELYREIVAQEIRLAAIESEDHILQIGCGAVPFTALHLAQQAGARVTAIDYDARAVKRARAVVARMNLAERITVECTKGIAGLTPSHTGVLVALQVRDKTGLYHAWHERSQPPQRIVFRQPQPAHAQEYGLLHLALPPDGTVHYAMRTFRTSLLYRRR